VLAYALFWLVVPMRRGTGPGDAGTATRQARPAWLVSGVGLLAVGGYWLLAGPSPSGLVLPGLLAGTGAALVWWQSEVRPACGPPVGATATLPWGLLGGSGLFATGAVVYIAGRVGIADLAVVLGALTVVGVGVALLAAPYLVALVRERDRERSARVLARERADVAAHLHDSVLQTLTLIQVCGADAQAMAGLARAEERALRQWLYGDSMASGAGDLAAALQQLAVRIEARHGGRVEVVVVGEPLDTGLPGTRAALSACSEAIVNAVRHSSDPQPVRVFADVRPGPDLPGELVIFIRDRGRGFDLDEVLTGRAASGHAGVRESIIGRIARAGGSAEIRTAPGAGTEVAIRVPLAADRPAPVGIPS
jgi:signal transduction histidine kinase